MKKDIVDNEKRIIFIGNPIPHEEVTRTSLQNVNTADNIAQNTMIEGLFNRYGSNLSVVSVSSSRTVKSFVLDCGVEVTSVYGKSNSRVAYYLSVMLNYSKAVIALLRTYHGKKTIIITNGPYIFMAIPSLIAKWLYKAKWVPFIVGAVEVPGEKFPFNLVSKLSRWTMRRANGAIVYVANSAIDYLPSKPYLEIAYLVGPVLMSIYKNHIPKKNPKFTITYTGSLTSTYNIDIVIEAIKLSGNMYRWVFAGSGEYRDKIRQLASDGAYDVEYVGVVDNKRAAELQMDSDILTLIRGVGSSEVERYLSKYAASGKATEYLCSGTPVLASEIPALSKNISSFMSCTRIRSAEQILNEVENIRSDYKNKVSLARLGQEYAWSRFTLDYQSEKIYDFLGGL